MATNKEFEIIIDFMPVKEADEAWASWLKTHDIKELEKTDIEIDTGLGERDGNKFDIRRYKIKAEKMKLVSEMVPNA